MASINSKLLEFFIYFNLVQLSLLINAVLATYNTGNNALNSFRVTGGYRPPTHTHAKYIISIRIDVLEDFFGAAHICGGVIIGPSTILTAGHCVFYPMEKMRAIKLKFRPGRLSVVAKTTNRLEQTNETEILKVEKILVHSDFSLTTMISDICVLKLNGAIKMDGKLAEILPLPDAAIKIGANCTYVGWGSLFIGGPIAAEAIYVNFNILPYDKCKVYDNTPTVGKLCVGDPNDNELAVCPGDSGGPLICDSKVVGLASYIDDKGGPPAVFTDVWYYRDWVKENCCCCNYNARVASIFILCAVILIIQ